MDFIYNLINTNHLTQNQIVDIEHGLEIKAYICQQEFEKFLDKYHQINVLADANDEAFVSKIEIDNSNIIVDLDCSKVRI